MADLHDIINASGWERVRQMLHDQLSYHKGVKFPKEHGDDDCHNIFSLRNISFGFSPFHAAVARRDCPEDVVSAMIELDPRHLTATTLWYDSATPLLIACETGSASTVHALLQLFAKHSSPMALSAYASTRDKDERSPLDVAWLGAIQPDHETYGFESLDSKTQSEFMKHLDSIRSYEDFVKNDAAMDLWTITVLLVCATREGKVHTPSSSLDSICLPCSARSFLGTIISPAESIDCVCLGNIPTIVTWFALRVLPKSCLLESDERGNLPVHLAASSLSSLEQTIELDESHHDFLLEESVYRSAMRSNLELVIEACPGAASHANGEGRLPLHIASETGISWKEGSEALFLAAPWAIEERDAKTNMYPFMLAAKIDGKDDNDDDRGSFENDLVLLDLVFRLLRAWPEGVRDGI